MIRQNNQDRFYEFVQGRHVKMWDFIFGLDKLDLDQP